MVPKQTSLYMNCSVSVTSLNLKHGSLLLHRAVFSFRMDTSSPSQRLPQLIPI